MTIERRSVSFPIRQIAMAEIGVSRRDMHFEELDVVRTRATLEVDGHLVPSGTVGAIVLVHRDGKAFEVEFTRPFPAVVTLQAGELEAVR